MGRPINSTNPYLKLLSCLEVLHLVYKLQALFNLAEVWHNQTLGNLYNVFHVITYKEYGCLSLSDIFHGQYPKKKIDIQGYLQGLNFCLIQTGVIFIRYDIIWLLIFTGR